MSRGGGFESPDANKASDAEKSKSASRGDLGEFDKLPTLDEHKFPAKPVRPEDKHGTDTINNWRKEFPELDEDDEEEEGEEKKPTLH